MQKETNIITISQLSLSTFLKPILILSQDDLFLYGTETMICQLKRQGRGQGLRWSQASYFHISDKSGPSPYQF